MSSASRTCSKFIALYLLRRNLASNVYKYKATAPGSALWSEMRCRVTLQLVAPNITL